MTTLLDFATNDLNRVTQDRTTAQTALAAAQAGLGSTQADRDATAAAIVDLQGQIAKKRQEIANAAMPADAEAAAADLEKLLIKLNAQQAHAVDLQVQLDTFQSQIDVQLAALGVATTRSAAVANAFAAAQKADTDQQAWHAALVSAPIQNIGQAATDAQAAALYTTAKTRAEAGFNADLLKHVRKRESNEQARLAVIRSTLDHMQDDLDAKEKADRGLAGAVAPLQTIYDRAEAAFRVAVMGAQDRFNRAQGLLATIAAAPALPDAEKNHMLDATIVNAAKGNAVTHEEALETARDAFTQANADLERAKAEESAGLTPFMTVANAQTAVGTAQGDLATAKGNFTQGESDALDAWEATVPDSSWTLLAAFDEADLILNDLESNATPVKLAALETAMKTAASNLADALDLLAKSDRAVALLGWRMKQQSELLDAAARSGSARVLNALRGDD